MEHNCIPFGNYMNQDQLTMKSFNNSYPLDSYQILPFVNNFGLENWNQNNNVSLFPFDLSNIPMSTLNDDISCNNVFDPQSLDYNDGSNYLSPLNIKEFTANPAETLERNDSWSSQETWKLIEVIMASRDAFQNIRRHPGLWAQLAIQLTEKGYPRSSDKCKNRWKVLVAKYKRCCREILQSNISTKSTGRRGNNNPKSFEFFDAMNVLLEPKFAFTGEGFVRKFKNGSIVCLATTSETLTPSVKRPKARRSSCEYGDPWEKVGELPNFEPRSN